jgi:hypothetical protein
MGIRPEERLLDADAAQRTHQVRSVPGAAVESLVEQSEEQRTLSHPFPPLRKKTDFDLAKPLPWRGLWSGALR